MIEDIRENFAAEEVYAIYAACMFEPTWEKFRERAEALRKDPAVRMFGYTENGAVLGVIVIREKEGGAEVCGIAVDETRRGHGIGGELVRYVMDELQPDVLYAETDDDAVGFYRNCGFATEGFIETYDSGPCRRYRCELRKG